MTNRVKSFTKPEANGKKAKKVNPAARGNDTDSSPPFSNYAGEIPLKIDSICESLLTLTGGWPKCISGVLCYVEKGEVRVLEDPAALFAWIGSHAPIHWRRGVRAVTKEEFFKRLRQRQRWAWATPYPHFPPVQGVLYLGDPPEAKSTGKINELVKRFLPKTDDDRELIKALILSLFWGGPPGKRPQFVIVADESGDEDAGRGTGKSTLPEYLSQLVGGCIDIDPSEDRGHIRSNLLSPTSWGQRIALIDNLKSARYSNDFLEKLVTRSEITGHRLYQGFATRPNLLVYIVTVNGAFFSTDMAQRSVVIRLARPLDTPQDWDAETVAFIESNRTDIVADIRWHLEGKEPKSLSKVDRWRPWCLNVLSRCENPDQLLQHIKQQRNRIDADKLEHSLALDHLRACIASELQLNSIERVDGMRVWAPTAWLIVALRSLKRDFTDRLAQQFLARLTSSPRLIERRQNDQRGYQWIGKNVDPKKPSKLRFIHYKPDIPSKRRQWQ